ncbi:unnamed protein product [Pleuronectes platessa]|uniref:Uncharacterized protein n=1 Tax=Pleuronectes platessa TaxID=8262 RepID=A0A9N7Z5E6_PLEPL|nr:unnamed protein product [Pleuronectes platessa]
MSTYMVKPHHWKHILPHHVTLWPELSWATVFPMADSDTDGERGPGQHTPPYTPIYNRNYIIKAGVFHHVYDSEELIHGCYDEQQELDKRAVDYNPQCYSSSFQTKFAAAWTLIMRQEFVCDRTMHSGVMTTSSPLAKDEPSPYLNVYTV